MIDISVREAPSPPLFERGEGSCRPAVPNEPFLRADNIQGNILAGFNKDFQTLLFLRITSLEDFRQWLADVVPFIATTAEVLAFNRLFKEIRRRRKVDSGTVKATWINIAFSYKGIARLAPKTAGQFKDEAFRAGLRERSESLGDPTRGDGSPESWVVGGPDNEADVVLIVASDDERDLLSEVERLEVSLYTPRAEGGKILSSGAKIVHKEFGAVLPPPLRGHEHFGFLDGVSQPGLRGRVSEDPRDVLTLRQEPGEDGQPANPDRGKPGQDLLWPGEFVFGYSGQDPKAKSITCEGPNSLKPHGKPIAPEWASDGSYLVFRRLRQRVPEFHAFLEAQAAEAGISSELLGAKLVGRFKQGAPIMRTQVDDPHLGNNDCANNDFEFSGEEEEEARTRGAVHGRGGLSLVQDQQGCPHHQATLPHPALDDCLCERSPEPEPDPHGLVCPIAAHIRKVYPRDDPGRVHGETGEVTTQTHRLLRRGIPFGPPYRSDVPPDQDHYERGLLFLAYQTSIEEQFEFVQRQWANRADFEEGPEEDRHPGHDLIIGQSHEPGGKRRFALRIEQDGQVEERTIETTEQWVIPTGGGYFFAPSIRALHELATGQAS